MPSSSSRFFPPSSAHIRKRIHVLYRAERQQKKHEPASCLERDAFIQISHFSFVVSPVRSFIYDYLFSRYTLFFFGWWELQAAAQVVSLLILVRELEMEAKKDKRRTAKKRGGRNASSQIERAYLDMISPCCATI